MEYSREVGGIVNVLMIEADENVLQEVLTFLSDKAKCQSMDIPLIAHSSDTLTFPRSGNPHQRTVCLPQWHSRTSHPP